MREIAKFFLAEVERVSVKKIKEWICSMRTSPGSLTAMSCPMLRRSSLDTSPIKRSRPADASSSYASRPGKLSRLNIGRRNRLNMNSQTSYLNPTCTNSLYNNNSNSYGSALQSSTGSRGHFRPTQSPVTTQGLPSPTSSRGTPPREPKLFGETPILPQPGQQ